MRPTEIHNDDTKSSGVGSLRTLVSGEIGADCNFTAAGGVWRYQRNISDASNPDHIEHVVHWAPHLQASRGCGVEVLPSGAGEPSPPPTDATMYRRFTQREALRCLANRTIVMFGNSNTRTLFIALESLLRGTPMMSRTAAKQMCGNSRTNHSCWTSVHWSDGPDGTVTVAASQPQTDRGAASFVDLKYWGYTHGLYHEELDHKMAHEKATADIVIGNSGLNSIQNYNDRVWAKEHAESIPKLRQFVRSFAEAKRTGGGGGEEESFSPAP